MSCLGELSFPVICLMVKIPAATNLELVEVSATAVNLSAGACGLLLFLQQMPPHSATGVGTAICIKQDLVSKASFSRGLTTICAFEITMHP